eukprot:TRINITY_DN1353_c0_g1_i1.p1 TRINITY_DN1353_c0_g1~~TRINITY_DN1353_c0_g1_i1.p1  ORF type:complete len:497 (-),score=221.09 TRINITY_DN1353_c0_g1_i1:93-1583(-)
MSDGTGWPPLGPDGKQQTGILNELKNIIQRLTIANLESTKALSFRESDPRCQELCFLLEAVAHYGLRDIGMFTSTTFWDFAQRIETLAPQGKDFVKRVNESSRSGLGRGRMFIRLCLNNHNTDSCFVALISNQKLVEKYYVHDSILRHPEYSSIFVSLVQGLKTVKFDLLMQDRMVDMPDFWRPFILQRQQLQSSSNVIEKRARNLSDALNIISPIPSPSISPSSSPPSSSPIASSLPSFSSMPSLFHSSSSSSSGSAIPSAISLGSVESESKLSSITKSGAGRPKKTVKLVRSVSQVNEAAVADNDWHQEAKKTQMEQEIKDLHQKNVELRVDLQKRTIEKQTLERNLRVSDGRINELQREIDLCKQKIIATDPRWKSLSLVNSSLAASSLSSSSSPSSFLPSSSTGSSAAQPSSAISALQDAEKEDFLQLDEEKHGNVDLTSESHHVVFQNKLTQLLSICQTAHHKLQDIKSFDETFQQSLSSLSAPAAPSLSS